MNNIYNKDFLAHHGILGQKWGKRNGPPYPLSGGDYTESEKNKIYKARIHPNSIYNKKHFDGVISTKDTLSTLSYDKDRTKGKDMFYATYKPLDKHQYNALFNSKTPQTLYDEKGKEIGKSECYKFKINNAVKKDIKVASEDSSIKIFKDLYKNDRDFYNFVSDPERMQSRFVDSKYKFKGYRESRKKLEKLRSGSEMSSEDVADIYRMFNYVIPSDAGGNIRNANDVSKQRAKFFRELKKNGYGACLDTNDAIYGGFKATAPVIVFDMSNIVLKDVETVNIKDKAFSNSVLVGRKLLGI